MKKLLSTLALAAASMLCSAERPNVVFVITDDQGYGDMGFTGNSVIQTPHMDKLAKESIWLEDYHVAPSCSPTRGSLMAGRWTNAVGTWHTFYTRAMMHDDEVTIADHFQAADYSTGMFGKWHLGDHYPFRPQDRGFDEVFCLQGGATGVTADYWDNDLYDDYLMHNGKITKTEGYITDVIFDAAEAYIKQQVKAEKPFFAYIATNAPHKPWVCPPEYSEPYAHLGKNEAAFNGMVTNIDDNMGALRKTLDELGVSGNTIFIFTTDNGTVNPGKFNANMRGKKGSAYEGGHRTPFMLHWPAGGFSEHKKVTELTHVVDVLPTLLELCAVKAQPAKPFDGHSLVELFKDGKGKSQVWQSRVVISDSQRLQFPKKWKDSSVMKGKWRLIRGKELYHVGDDPSQEKDVSKKYPEITEELRQWYEKWWAKLEPSYDRISEIRLGGEHGSDITLTCLQWMDTPPPWNQGFIRKGPKIPKKDNAKVFGGYLAVKVLEKGKYQLSVRRWPKESGLKICEGVAPLEPRPGCLPSYSYVKGRALPITAATMRINGTDLETKPVSEQDAAISFIVELEKGSQKLSPYFTQELKGGRVDRSLGCYYIDVKKLAD
ncbi:arylsulfatase [Rubritalea spongiae]|uniref:Arylsulfatase n=1 Tax=Rubritalea spongiae TaxID=430797 RepID=A0ABW5E3Z0_9BACT